MLAKLVGPGGGGHSGPKVDKGAPPSEGRGEGIGVGRCEGIGEGQGEGTGGRRGEGTGEGTGVGVGGDRGDTMLSPRPFPLDLQPLDLPGCGAKLQHSSARGREGE